MMAKLKVYMQTLGKSMLIPIVSMPLAGLTLRLAADDMLNIPLLMAAGNAVFGNLDLIFAIGVAMGFAKTKDRGIPALTAFLGIMVLKQGLLIMDKEINMGVFGGIIMGIVSAAVYNRFKNQKLPNFLGFFAGEKFPITVILVVATALSYVFGIIWPTIQDGIDSFTQLLVTLGPWGVFLFLFLNRLLIPVGLHHVLNTYVYFVIGDYVTKNGDMVHGEIPRFLNGDPTAGLFLAAFFSIMMFGIPAIALAITKAAKKERKQEVKGIMSSAGLTSIVAGITEPVEFTFLFTSPLLYLIHAVYAGLVGIVMYYLNVHMAFSFGASLVDYVLNFNIATSPIYILVVGVVVFAVYYFTFYTMIIKKNIKLLGREDNIEFNADSSEAEKNLALSHDKYEFMAKKILEHVGGKENIVSAENCITRLRLEIKDMELINEQLIKQTGAHGVVKVGDHHFQIVIGTQVTYVADEFKKLLG